jgi:23S rRNA (uracil1939-C5)-methyltransferase
MGVVSSVNHRAHPCPHYPNCFGCRFIDLPYPEQLRRKHNRLAEAFAAHPSLSKTRIQPIVASPQRLGYRARVKLVVAQQSGRILTGLYEPGTHHVSDISSCPVHPRAVNQVVQYLKGKIARLRINPYDQQTDRGQLRYLDIRYSVLRQEVAVTLVTRHNDFPEGPKLARELMRRFRFVSGVVQNINETRGNVIWGNQFRTLTGRDSILERNGFLKLKFPAGVFSQANPRVASKLYDQVLNLSQLKGDEIVVDAYCGVGPISLYLASRSRLVWGTDENPLSIATAKQNARMNGFGNCRFFVGDVAETAREAAQKLRRVDIVTVNPPRKGMRPEALAGIVALNPCRLIYVSCDPVTLARDITKLLECGYIIASVRPFDMFPQTEDLETVVSLAIKP